MTLRSSEPASEIDFARLVNFEPPATDEDFYAAALPYVRKVSGTRPPRSSARSPRSRRCSRGDRAAATHGVPPRERSAKTLFVVGALQRSRVVTPRRDPVEDHRGPLDPAGCGKRVANANPWCSSSAEQGPDFGCHRADRTGRDGWSGRWMAGGPRAPPGTGQEHRPSASMPPGPDPNAPPGPGKGAARPRVRQPRPPRPERAARPRVSALPNRECRPGPPT